VSNEQEIEKALKVAEQIINAIKKKIPKYDGFVRRYESAGTGFIELAIRPEDKAGRASEITTAYSDEYFLSANADNIKDKAKRILNDFRVLLGVKV
jgi:hypothetical protein